VRGTFVVVAALGLLSSGSFGLAAPNPAASKSSDPVRGCLARSYGNYTVSEDGTNRTFQIAVSSVELQSHLGQDVEVIGRKPVVPINRGSSDDALVVIGLNVIAQHCAGGAARSVATLSASSTGNAAVTAMASGGPDTSSAGSSSSGSSSAPVPGPSVNGSSANGCSNCTLLPVQESPRRVTLEPGLPSSDVHPVSMSEEASKLDAIMASIGLALALIIIFGKRRCYHGPSRM